MEKAICPVCQGSGRQPVSPEQERYKQVMSGYDSATNTLPCQNCGGQCQYGRPSGHVRLNREGEACTHLYQSRNAGRCLTDYTCVHCNDSYQIDSGD